MADLTSAVEEMNVGIVDIIKFASEFRQIIRKAKPDSDPSKNFTWEHFFTEHCGILPNDARKYEKDLIAHRMDPLDTLLESLVLIIEYGRIPIGDKLKITKTIKVKEEVTKTNENAMEKARKVNGLEKYNVMQARMIMNYAGGDSEDHIDYGIEVYEEGMEELERMASIQMIKDPKCAESHAFGASLAKMTHDPTYLFLRSFGYETFEYTKDKSVDETAVPRRTTSSDPFVESILLGNVSEQPDLNDSVPDQMYT